ncbi:MAG TPA: PH domain-containing protein [Pirellulales bacterium]|nr:PH domain-containing protein [Pirellulales bacterium]
MSAAEPAGRVEHASGWIYQGVWSVLVRWFRVPDRPPALPVPPGETLDAFRPALGFLRYLKFKFGVAFTVIDGFILIGWLATAVASPLAGAILALPALALAVLLYVVVYIAIHLQYDTTWYVLSGRSLRIRRGIWTIHETTITFENVQNVEVNQGPLQRCFGIADVHVDTAGGGGKQAAGAHGSPGGTAGHRGLIEGVADAARIRDLVLSRLRGSRTAGLGDEHHPVDTSVGWTADHVTALREIRDLARALAATRG